MQANFVLKSPTCFRAAGTQANFSPNLFSKTFRAITSFFCKIRSLFTQIFAGQNISDILLLGSFRTVTRLDLTNVVKPGHLMILAAFRFLRKSVLRNTFIKTPLLNNKTIISQAQLFILRLLKRRYWGAQAGFKPPVRGVRQERGGKREKYCLSQPIETSIRQMIIWKRENNNLSTGVIFLFSSLSLVLHSGLLSETWQSESSGCRP